MPGTIACQTLDFFIRFRAGGCFVTPCQGTLQIRKTPWHGVTKQPPAVPLPGPNVTPEPNEKIKGLAGNFSRHTKQATRHPSNQENTLARRDETVSCPEPNEKIKGLAGNCSRHTKQATRKTPWHGVTKQPPAVLCPGQTSLLNRMKKSRVWQAIVPGTQNKPQDTLQIRKTPWHGVTKQPPAVPLPGPNVTPEPNEKSRVWQAIFPGTQNKPQDTLQIRETPWHGVAKQPKQPSNQENTLASRRNGLLPSLCPGS